MTSQTGEIQQFVDFLGRQIQTGAATFTPEESVKEFRAYQEELERCRREVQKGLEQHERGESKPLDIEDVIARGRQRLAEKGVIDNG